MADQYRTPSIREALQDAFDRFTKKKDPQAPRQSPDLMSAHRRDTLERQENGLEAQTLEQFRAQRTGQ
jgi:hypothetical protein